MNATKRSGYFPATREQGAALVLVLSLLALMTVMCVAFLFYSTRQQRVSTQSAMLVQGPEAAEVAVDLFLQDLRAEIRAGSVLPDPDRVHPALTQTVLYPATPLSAVPDRTTAVASGAATSAPNLVKQSAAGRKFYDDARVSPISEGLAVYPRSSVAPVPDRVSGVSTVDPKAPGGMNAAKWNRPLLLPRKYPESSTDLTPAETGATLVNGSEEKWVWEAPRWIYLQKNGQTPKDLNGKQMQDALVNGGNPVMARYAFQVYDVGGLLDLNVAGFDPALELVKEPAPLYGARKGSQGYADLEVLGFRPADLKKLVAMRNAATLEGDDDGPHRNRYTDFLLNGRSNLGFLRVAAQPEKASKSSKAGIYNRAFPSRTALIRYISDLDVDSKQRKAELINALEYLTHFSRGLEQPSYVPGFWDWLSQDKESPAMDPEKAHTLFPRVVPPQMLPDGSGRSEDKLHAFTETAPAVYQIDRGVANGVGSARKDDGVLEWWRTEVRLQYPWEMAIANNRGGNDAWGKLKERGGGALPGAERFLQDLINPAFLEVRVPQGVAPGTQRVDGSRFAPGEPLVKKRFPLERLAWLTFEGPSADLRTSDPKYHAMGTAENIRQCFGLVWDKDTAVWRYTMAKPSNSAIYKLEELAAIPREPNFFELLKATIACGSLGKSAVGDHDPGNPYDPATYYHLKDRSVDFQVLDIGVNVIDQYDRDNFPTTVFLPNYDSESRASIPYDAYKPPLHAARGVEDLPYFYRFHWRGIPDDGNPVVNGLVLGEGPKDVTESLRDRSNFNGGSTALVGFPELWNPHTALTTPPTGLDDGPTEFRIVAVSEFPESLVDPLLDRVPRSRAVYGVDYQSDFFSSGDFSFGIAPSGRFLYTASVPSGTPGPGLNFSQSLFDGAAPYGYSGFDTRSSWWNSGSPLSYSTASHTFLWPLELSTNGVTTLGVAGGTGYKAVLRFPFWPSAPRTTFDPILRARASSGRPGEVAPYFSIALLPMSRAPVGGFTSILPLTPESAPLRLDSNSDAPNFTPKLEQVGIPAMLAPPSGTNYAPPFTTTGILATRFRPTQDGVGLSPGGPKYPYCPDPTKIFPAANFSLDPRGSTSGADHPSVWSSGPIKAWQGVFFVMSDASISAEARQRYGSAPSLSIPPGTPSPGSGGNESGNRILDKRGTELLFTVSRKSLFREPTVLCQPGVPAGSDLKGGQGNFLGMSGISGLGGRWVGFSMGEVPQQTIVLSKMSVRNAVNGPADSRFVFGLGNVATNTRVDQTVGMDVATNLEGAVLRVGTFNSVTGVNRWDWDGNGQIPPPADDWETGYFTGAYGGEDLFSFGTLSAVGNRVCYNLGEAGTSASASAFYRVRYFLVPTNAVGLEGTRFTVRLQYKNRFQKWVTYDEKFCQIYDRSPAGMNRRMTTVPVPLTTEKVMNLANTSGFLPPPPNDFTDTGRTLGAGTPLLTAYDPRTARFGMAMRSASDTTGSTYSGIASYAQLLAPSEARMMGFNLGLGNDTARPDTALFDGATGGPPLTIACSNGVPAAYARTFYWYGSTSIRLSWRMAMGMDRLLNNPPTPQPSWAGRPSEYLCPPTLNATDYGWFSRYAPPIGGTGIADAHPSLINKSGDYRLSNAPDLPNFFQNSQSLTRADFRNQAASRLGGVNGVGRLSTWDFNANTHTSTAPIADALRVGAFEENVAPALLGPGRYAQCYADPDDVVRRAAGAYAIVTGDYVGIDGLPMAKAKASQTPDGAGTRPVVLNRPFRSVAEMGYAFRGGPWKSLSFFTPETGDAGLLDVFCLTEPPAWAEKSARGDLAEQDPTQPVVAGKVDLNTRQELVLRALIKGVLRDEATYSGRPLVADGNLATLAAAALVARTTGTKMWNGPLTNVSELAGKIFARDLRDTDYKATDPVYTSVVQPSADVELRNPQAKTPKDKISWHFTGYSADLDSVLSTLPGDQKNQRLRESVIRALADAGQTRVWNLMVDLIVQPGRLPQQAQDFTRFVKEGETRVWVYLAVDRLTGEVLEKHWEYVPE